MSGADPTHSNPVAAHVHTNGHTNGQKPPSRAGSNVFANVFGGSQPPTARKLASGTTVTVTRSVGMESPSASRLASSGRAFSDGPADGGSTLQDDAVQ
mmetsp:Transcript_24827/g.57391  ORF Transcript_24827/g.57391 Transcript_24827/m.57391 type:complete len:98 (+) Transcript_24827:27-320(+)